VIAGVKSSQKKDAESLGAASVAALDDDQALAGLPELDAIADTVNGDTVAKLIPKLKRSGRLVTVVGAPDAAKKAGVEVRDVWARPDPDRLNRLAEDVRDGKLKMPIARRMRLSEVREAHELAEQGVNGKIALLP
jgi:NADPH:quinone reductase-like Zn-dependent oxidoreductase